MLQFRRVVVTWIVSDWRGEIRKRKDENQRHHWNQTWPWPNGRNIEPSSLRLQTSCRSHQNKSGAQNNILKSRHIKTICPWRNLASSLFSLCLSAFCPHLYLKAALINLWVEPAASATAQKLKQSGLNECLSAEQLADPANNNNTRSFLWSEVEKKMLSRHLRKHLFSPELVFGFKQIKQELVVVSS